MDAFALYLLVRRQKKKKAIEGFLSEAGIDEMGSGIIGLALSCFAAYLSYYNCTQNQEPAWRFLYAFLAFSFSSLYILWYFFVGQFVCSINNRLLKIESYTRRE